MESSELTWSGKTWRLPLWFWLSLAAMAFSTMHILLDFGVGLFEMKGTLAPALAAVVLLIPLIQVWWVVSLAAGAQGSGGGVASTVILGLGWTVLINGLAIQYCMPPCSAAAPLSDVSHIGSLVFGVAGPAVGIRVLWRKRVGIGWVLPAGALVLVVATVWALATSGPS